MRRFCCKTVQISLLWYFNHSGMFSELNILDSEELDFDLVMVLIARVHFFGGDRAVFRKLRKNKRSDRLQMTCIVISDLKSIYLQNFVAIRGIKCAR